MEEVENKIARKFDFKSLLWFSIPTISMMVFLSLYSIIDGIFIANHVGTNGVAATNIIMPLFSLILGIGIMFATGGSALVAKQIGEGKTQEANSSFTLIVVVGILIGVILSIIGIVFMDPLIKMLGATEALYENCKTYMSIIVGFAPIVIFKTICEQFFVTAGKPNLGLMTSIVGGVINIILDYVFIVKADMGIQGAAIATVIGQTVPNIIGIVFFFNKNNAIHFVKPEWKKNTILEAMANGASEMVTQLSSGIVTYIFNICMLKYAGEDGVAAVSIIAYIQFLAVALFLGYSSGVAPIISYNYGNENKEQLKKVVGYSIKFTIATSIIICIGIYLFSGQLIQIFTKNTTNAYQIAKDGIMLYGIAFLLIGMNVFASSLFTALSNGKISALISFLKNLGLVVLFVAILPKFMEIQGVWISVPLAEFCTVVISVVLIMKYRQRYGY